jgi:hypothetical protein
MWEMFVYTVIVLILLIAIPNLTDLPIKSERAGSSTVNIQTAHSDLAEWNQVLND